MTKRTFLQTSLAILAMAPFAFTHAFAAYTTNHTGCACSKDCAQKCATSQTHKCKCACCAEAAAKK